MRRPTEAVLGVAAVVLILAGYDVTVRPGASFTSNTSLFGTDTFTVGEITVSIAGDVLSVNDVSYGSLSAGDTVLVKFGRVYVSGQLRSRAE